MKDFPTVDQDYELWVLLHQTKDAIEVAREKELRPYGISLIQSAVLFVVQAIGYRATPAEISRWLLRWHHSVSGLLNRMEKGGLVKRVKDLDKKNLVRVAITEKGREAYYQSSKRESIHRIMSSLSEEQRRQVALCLKTLRDSAIRESGLNRTPPFP
jgi:DNA-binding MarR family transcriptional regulator